MISPEELAHKREVLVKWFAPFRRCVVAYSGGVDSAVVAQAAYLALGEGALAVTGESASLASGELVAATDLAQRIGIRHQVLPTHEVTLPAYIRNDSQRCFHCKTELYSRLQAVAAAEGAEVLVNGANADDEADFRPGMRAAADHQIRSPLVECQLVKADVRALAAMWELPVHDKPATPCLASRIAYGEEVTPERLAMIDRAEQFLRSQGLRTIRVRYHRGGLARIEVRPEELANLVEVNVRMELVQYFQQLGFQFVTLDLQGFRSGSLNSLVSLTGTVSP